MHGKVGDEKPVRIRCAPDVQCAHSCKQCAPEVHQRNFYDYIMDEMNVENWWNMNLLTL